MTGHEINRGCVYPHVLGRGWALARRTVHLGAGTVEETILVPRIIGLLLLCCRNVSSVRSGGKELLAAVCSALMAVAQLPST